jgi:cyclopropane-fatty-acyl-phospholipid synthase
MAAREDLEFTYSLTDRIFPAHPGELADFSAAKYDGDFSLSLEEAQRRKHCYGAEQIGIGPGRRILGLGCAWGPPLDFVRSRRGSGIAALTLSRTSNSWARGRDGIEVSMRFVQGLAVREGQIVRFRGFGTFDEAFEAVALRD